MTEQNSNALSRRDFLKGVGVVGAAAGAASIGLPGIAGAATKATATSHWMPAKWDYLAEIVVIGYGFAGQAAAIEAVKVGKASSVIILEKAPFRERGGNSRVCGQGMIAPDPDIWADYKEYLKMATEGQGYPTTSGQGFTSQDTIDLYVEGSHESIQWFQDLGYPLKPDNLFAGPGEWIPFYPNFPGADAIASKPQFYWVDESLEPAKTIMKGKKGGKDWYCLEDYILNNAAVKDKIEIKYKSPAKRLVQNPETREVLGVVVTQAGKEKTIKARKAVIVCAGGWEYNQDWVRKYQHRTNVFSMGSPMNTGETIDMCADAGAALRNMGVVAAPTYVSAGVLPGYKSAIQAKTTIDAGAFIMIGGKNSKRFQDEYQGPVYGISQKTEAATEGAFCYTGQQLRNGLYQPINWPGPVHYIFDETALKAGPLFSGSWATQVENYKCSSDNSAELANGWIIEGNNLADLVTKMNAKQPYGYQRNLADVEATIDKWNADCNPATPKDTQFEDTPFYQLAVGADGKNANGHVQCRRPDARLVPFDKNAKMYAIQVYQLTLNTQGGMVRNPDGRVMSIDGPPIPRLYAAGENGDMWTNIYQCMSNVGGGCFAYGRAAGKKAAAETAWDATAMRTPMKKAAKK